MKKFVALLVFAFAGFSLFAQADALRLAPGAEGQLADLLNTPTMVKPTTAVPLGRNWFTLETDAHVFSDEVSVQQVAAVLLGIENYSRYFDGRRSKLTGSIASRGRDETIVDFVSVAIVPVLYIRLNTPYRASVRTLTHTDTRFAMDIQQLPQDSESNGKIKNLYAVRYAEEVIIGGKKYTYIRMYTMSDVDANILPGAKGTLERNGGPINEEALLLLVEAAKTK